MKTVWKYPLALVDEQMISIPKGAVLFKVGLDPDGKLCVWALVESDNPVKPQRFYIVGTGHEVPDDAYLWVGTVTSGKFVWHIFTP